MNRFGEYFAIAIVGVLEIGLKIFMTERRIDREEKIIERRTKKYLEEKDAEEEEA